MEEWKEIPGYAGFFVSDTGRIRSRKGKVLKPCYPPNGYPQVRINKLGEKGISKNIAGLVSLVWLGERPAGHEVHHINRDIKDNRADNLQYLPMRMNRGKNDLLGIAKCPICNTDIPRHKKTCSKKCHDINHRITLTCSNCKKKFTIYKSQHSARKRYSTNFYCSKECWSNRIKNTSSIV